MSSARAGRGPTVLADRGRLIQDEITRVAAICFGEMGYRATSLDTIAAKIGISKVTLYKYVSGKEELLWRVFERTIDAFRTGLRQIVEQDLAADEKLRRIIRYQVNLLTGHLPFLTVFFSEESGLSPDMARRVAREKRQYDRTIERVVRDGMAEGRLRDLPPTLLVFALLGMCNWLYKWYRPDGPLTPDLIADTVVDVVEHGYLTPQAPSGGDAVSAVLHRIDARLARLERRRERAPARTRAAAVTRPRKATSTRARRLSTNQ